MTFDLELCIEQVLQKQLLADVLIREICEKTKEILMRESNVVQIQSPVTVVGDLHGYNLFKSFMSIASLTHLVHVSHSQYLDLIEIFRIGGYSPHTNYLFLGTSAKQGSLEVYRLIPLRGLR